MTPPTKHDGSHGGDGNDDRSPDAEPPPRCGGQNPTSEKRWENAAQRNADRADRQ